MDGYIKDILRAISDAVFVVDAEGIILTVNEAAKRLSERSEVDLLGEPMDTVLRGTEARSIAEVDSVDTELASASGVYIPVRVTITRLCDGAGAPPGFVVKATDVRERRRLEAELHQAQRLEAVGHLAAGVAHEINTPIQFVGDGIEFLKGAFADLVELTTLLVGELPAERSPALAEAIERASLDYLVQEVPAALEQTSYGVKRVARIVRAMKELSHTVSTPHASADFNHVVENALLLAQNEYRYVADLETRLGDLPTVRCDVAELSQAVLNLIVNAAHAVGDVFEATARRGKLTVTTAHVNGRVELRISDTGPGIPAEVQGRIFDPFFTTKEVGRGTGQGLTIARATVVDRHKGTLTFETQPGVGTTFIVTLPATPIEESADDSDPVRR